MSPLLKIGLALLGIGGAAGIVYAVTREETNVPKNEFRQYCESNNGSLAWEELRKEWVCSMEPDGALPQEITQTAWTAGEDPVEKKLPNGNGAPNGNGDDDIGGTVFETLPSEIKPTDVVLEPGQDYSVGDTDDLNRIWVKLPYEALSYEVPIGSAVIEEEVTQGDPSTGNLYARWSVETTSNLQHINLNDGTIYEVGVIIPTKTVSLTAN